MRRITFAFLSIVSLMFLSGCGAQSTTTLYKAAGAGDSSTQLTTQLYNAGLINIAKARSAYEVQLSFYGATSTFNTANENYVANGGVTAAAVASDAQAVANEGVTVLAQLQAMQQGNSLLRSKKLKTVGPTKDAKTGVDITAVIAIAQLVSDLSPEIGALFTNIFSSTAATQAQVDAALSTWNTDLTVLAGLIITAPVPPTTSP